MEQENASELLDAIQKLDKYIGPLNKPTAVNISMGTHVGPHDGSSALERQLDGIASARDTFVHVSAGNDGDKGYHAAISLLPNDPDILVLTTGPAGSKELLVEFWWEDTGAKLTIDVEVLDAQKTRAFAGPLTLSSSGPATLVLGSPLGPADRRQSLVHLKCIGNRSCAAYGLSATQALPLSNLEIRFKLTSADSRRVHAWIIRCTDPDTTFRAASRDGTLSVPATAADVVAIAGVQQNQQPWLPSSRGPQCWYGSSPAARAPLIANLATWGTSVGTSISCARTTAETAEKLLRNLSQCSSRSNLLELLLNRMPLPPWTPRVGHGVIV